MLSTVYTSIFWSFRYYFVTANIQSKQIILILILSNVSEAKSPFPFSKRHTQAII